MSIGMLNWERSPFKIRLFLLLAVILSSALAGVTQVRAQSQFSDLTGFWLDDTNVGVVYRVRQIGNDVYWTVDATSKGSFANTYHGRISGNTITGDWEDMPGSPFLGGGSLTLRIESSDRLVKTGSSAVYGAQEWRRQGSSASGGNSGGANGAGSGGGTTAGASCGPGNAANYQLSGVWEDNTSSGAVYRLRQIGNKLYWGVDATSKGSFANLYHGDITGNSIAGEWADMPGSPSLSGGNMTLCIVSNDRLVKSSSTALYGAQEWHRLGNGAEAVTSKIIPAGNRPSVEQTPEAAVRKPAVQSKPQVEEIPEAAVRKPAIQNKPQVEEIPEAPPASAHTPPPTPVKPAGAQWTLASVTMNPPTPTEGWTYNAQSQSAHYKIYNGDQADFRWTVPPQQIGSNDFTVSVSVSGIPTPNNRVAATISVTGVGLITDTPGDQQSANVLAEGSTKSAQKSVTFRPAPNSTDVEVIISFQWAISFTYKYRRAQ